MLNIELKAILDLVALSSFGGLQEVPGAFGKDS